MQQSGAKVTIQSSHVSGTIHRCKPAAIQTCHQSDWSILVIHHMKLHLPTQLTLCPLNITGAELAYQSTLCNCYSTTLPFWLRLQLSLSSSAATAMPACRPAKRAPQPQTPSSTFKPEPAAVAAAVTTAAATTAADSAASIGTMHCCRHCPCCSELHEVRPVAITQCEASAQVALELW